MTAEEIKNEETIRDLFRKAFLDKDQYQVLTLILVRLGYFTDRPEAVKPDLQAFAGWLLRKCGIIHDVPGSSDFFYAQAHEFTQAIARKASTSDLLELKKAANTGPSPEELDIESRR